MSSVSFQDFNATSVDTIIADILGPELTKLYTTFLRWLENLRTDKNVFEKARVIETYENQLTAHMAAIVKEFALKEREQVVLDISSFLTLVKKLPSSQRADFAIAVSILRKVLVQLEYSRTESSHLDDKLARNLALLGSQLKEALNSHGKSANKLLIEVRTADEKTLGHLTEEPNIVNCLKFSVAETEAERRHEEALESFKKAQADAFKALEEVLKAQSALIEAEVSSRKDKLVARHEKDKQELVGKAVSR
jgi:hypothetical protein